MPFFTDSKKAAEEMRAEQAATKNIFKPEELDYSIDAEYTRHGGAYDRGSADRYYGTPSGGPEPHYYTGATGASDLITTGAMNPYEIAAYMQGWNEETDRKDYGEDFDKSSTENDDED